MAASAAVIPCRGYDGKGVPCGVPARQRRATDRTLTSSDTPRDGSRR